MEKAGLPGVPALLNMMSSQPCLATTTSTSDEGNGIGGEGANGVAEREVKGILDICYDDLGTVLDEKPHGGYAYATRATSDYRHVAY